MTRSLLHFVWLLIAVVAGQVHITLAGAANEGTLAIVASIIGLQSMYGFLTQGGNLLNASSVTLYAVILFAIFPALHIAAGSRLYAHKTDIESLIIAVILAGMLQWVILSICPPTKIQLPRPLDYSLHSSAGNLAIFLFVVTLTLSADALGLLQNAVGFITILFASLSCVAAPTVARFVASAALAAMTFGYYTVFIFDGFGRLILGMITIGVLMLVTLRFSGYFVKAGILAVTAPAIILLSYQRVSFLEESRGTDITFGEGLGSIVGPFTSAGVIINRMLEDVIEPSLGTTIFSALVVWIPSALWGGKPSGFGSEMVTITRPELAHVEIYSDAALITGEAVWNFGVWGSVLMFVILALWVRALDKWFANAAAKPLPAQSAIVLACQIVLIAVLSCGILNLFWGGWHTYTTRLFVSVPILAIIWFLGWLAGELNQKSKNSQQHPRVLKKQLHNPRSRL